jgi:DNA helicase-2/ATP-dependent DNA helicase PcrA
MKYLADLHIHSHFSIATSKELVPEHLDLWGRIKGITDKERQAQTKAKNLKP